MQHSSVRDKTEHQTDPENSSLLVDAIGDGAERVLPSERLDGIKGNHPGFIYESPTLLMEALKPASASRLL